MPGDRRLAAGGGEEGAEHPHGRGLARAVRAEEAEDLALGDREVDVADGLDLALLEAPADLLGR